MQTTQGKLYKQVKDIPIIDVLKFYGFYKGSVPSRGSVQIPCPLPGHHHDSTSKRCGRSMNIDLGKNKATCWSSNCSHAKIDFRNCMHLLATIRGDQNQQFVKHLIAKDFGIISEETFQNFLNGDTNLNYELREVTTYIPHRDVVYFEELAPVEKIDKVIRALMVTYRVYKDCRSKNLLSHEDYAYLHDERGLSDTFIKEGYYFTFPSEYMYPTFVKVLIQNKIIKEKSELDTLLKGVPGFYFNKKINQWSYATSESYGRFVTPKGIGIPIMNADKKFIGIQIRKSKTSTNQLRYTWHTSKNFVGDDFDFGISPGSPLSVVFPHKHERNILFITEGHFKAKRLADTFGCITISVQGVANFNGIEKEIKTLMTTQGYSFSHIIIAYDADLACKKEVFIQSRRLIEHLNTELSSELISTQLMFACWDIQYGKGIDDVIEAGQEKHLSRLNANQFLQLTERMFEEVGSFKDWTEEQRVFIFKQKVLSNFPKYHHLAI